MTDRLRSSSLDPLLRPYVEEGSDHQAEEILARLLLNVADPIIEEILSYKARVCTYGAARYTVDVEDIHSVVHERLIRRLRRARTEANETRIDDFHDYVAVVAYNAFHEYLREKHPEWARLKNRLEYLMTHRTVFATWKTDRHTQQCGLQAMRQQRIEAHARTRLQKVIDNPSGFVEEAVAANDPAGLEPLLVRLFEWVAGPIELNQLVTIVAGLTGIAAPEVAPPGPDDAPSGDLPGRGPTIEDALSIQEYVAQVWTEICALPVRQRVALLLNFDEIHGLPIIGIASIRQVAEVLEMSVDRLAELWTHLPIEDNEIARCLGVPRQQVINLRKSARDRLFRRMGRKRASHAS